MFRQDIEKKILEFVKKSPLGVTSSDIAKALGVNRMTMTKYLAIIKEKALIDFKQFGMAKLWYIPVNISRESFLNKTTGHFAEHMPKEEFRKIAEKVGISMGENINSMYLRFYDADNLTFDQLCDVYHDVGKKLSGQFKVIAKFNEKITVKILQNPFEGKSSDAMVRILSAVFAKIASMNVGYAKALVNKDEEGNSIIEVYLKKETQ